ncbi:hypothetical protein GWI33_022442 [Rhynchophorus ferrugineus]|uniref:DUF229 domain containing protein n=1 Tax=Rhynchophorus ferrugineus TaxID=354439 RepID=A0A834MJ19_RHYFE|nr:hypothetical protein GWI33_022442 [Rhynchophorus ferrugineus]
MRIIRYLYTVVHKKVYFLWAYPFLLRKVIFGLIVILVGLLIFLSYSDTVFRYSANDRLNYHYRTNVKYLINTSNCQIPDIDPFNEDVLPYVRLETKEECTSKPLLTYIEKSNGDVKLRMNKSVIYLYSILPMSCCYSKVFRKGDENIFYSECTNFDEEIQIDYGIVRVKCSNLFRITYDNVHATFIPHASQTRINTNATKPHTIFLLGIDSISRLNLQRTMPKTFSYLEQHFKGLRGYNKIGDNTFPNLMAILTGRSLDTLGETCKRNETFDNCDFIWNAFKEQGFVTAYGEDEPDISTFSFYKRGFMQAPTHYYLRPYFMSAYHLPVKTKYSMTVCSGYENTGSRMFNAVKDFELSVSGVPSFALFWMNSFSHDNINLPSSMDQTTFDFLTDAEMANVFRDSTVIIFSDHGFRFGDVRFTYTGWMEERLPFIYFKFPVTFRDNYPNLYENFVINAQQRLLTPYDFHMTLKHLVSLYNDSLKIEPSVACSNAKSIFEQIPENRSCADACIPEHWCTCSGYNYISIKETVVSLVAHFLVNQINEIIEAYSDEAYLCAEFELKEVISVGKARQNGTSDVFLIIIRTNPYAMFEATVHHDLINGSFNLLGDVSRLNLYRHDTTCITKNGGLKKYCVCKGWLTRLKSALCYYVGC